jgi:8-amino-7-oxononanoate synthase
VSDTADRIDSLHKRGLHRQMRSIDGPQGPHVRLDGAEVLLLCSNNYLGFADHPRVRQAAADAAERWGAGTGASRLVSGNMELHLKLEQRLAEFHGAESALLFGAGYLANTGLIPSLAGKGDVVFSDELNHASLIDGCRLSRAETFVYRHRDVEHLAWGLEKAGSRGALIVTDGIFSMDGDLAPLPELAVLARRFGVRLMVDDAHAIGVVGPGGRGSVAAAGLESEVDVVVGTLGKALGSYGAYACLSEELRELMINVARPFVFSTAPPPPAIGAAIASLSLLASRPGLAAHLRRNAAMLRQALESEMLDVGDSRSQIVPIIVGDARRATALSERALEGGVYAQAIRPPTVPDGTSRLRLTVMASHRVDELQAAARVIGRAARELGVTRRASAADPGLQRAA